MPAAARVGSTVQGAPHGHGAPCCPHSPIGNITTGSPNVFISGMPAARVGDQGPATACCGPNTFLIIKGSATVFINGKAAARVNDETLHCGIGPGKIVDGEPRVIIG